MRLVCDYSGEPIQIGEPVIVELDYLNEIIFVKQKYYEAWLKQGNGYTEKVEME